jgi:hypothetical protein
MRTLGEFVEELSRSADECEKLSNEEWNGFLTSYRESVSEPLEEIRREQRHAFEESKSVALY